MNIRMLTSTLFLMSVLGVVANGINKSDLSWEYKLLVLMSLAGNIIVIQEFILQTY